MKKNKLGSFKTIINIIVFIVFTVLSLIILYYHEPWRDEAQAWLIARDLNIIGIFKQMVYEGHPCLWHLILFPFAKLGMPYSCMRLISWFIMWITALLILKKSPFNIVSNVLIIFSTPFLYTYSSIARSYCLIPLAIVLIAINYEKRHDKPLKYISSLLLLSSTHVIMFSMVGILFLQFFYDEIIVRRNSNSKKQKKKIYLCLFISIVTLFIICFPILLSFKKNSLVNTDAYYVEPFHTVSFISSLIFKKDTLYILYFLILLFLYFVIYEMIFFKNNMCILYLSIIYQIIIYNFVYEYSIQRIESFIFIFIFIIWIQKSNKEEDKFRSTKFFKTSTIILNIILLFLLYNHTKTGFDWIKNDIEGLYSSSNQVANYIENNMNDNDAIIGVNMANTSAIIPYIKKDIIFYSPSTRNSFTYVTWSKDRNNNYNSQDIKYMIENDLNDRDNIYIVCSGGCSFVNNLLQQKYVQLVFRSDHSEKEDYVLYKVMK